MSNNSLSICSMILEICGLSRMSVESVCVDPTSAIVKIWLKHFFAYYVILYNNGSGNTYVHVI